MIDKWYVFKERLGIIEGKLRRDGRKGVFHSVRVRDNARGRKVQVSLCCLLSRRVDFKVVCGFGNDNQFWAGRVNKSWLWFFGKVEESGDRQDRLDATYLSAVLRGGGQGNRVHVLIDIDVVDRVKVDKDTQSVRFVKRVIRIIMKYGRVLEWKLDEELVKRNVVHYLGLVDIVQLDAHVLVPVSQS
jgi:hypothetical protein